MKQTVSVKYFSNLADITGKRSETLEIEPGQTVGTVLENLAGRHPEIKKFFPVIRPAVNQQYSELEQELSDGDELAFITPVSGG